MLLAGRYTFAMNPHFFEYQARRAKGFDPIAPHGILPLVLALRAELFGGSNADLIRLEKSQSGKLTYGSWGIGSLGHVGVVMLEKIANIDLLHVPYQGVLHLVKKMIAIVELSKPYSMDAIRDIG